jgi:tripartite ATP-independent transporter DctM subunit
MTITILVIVFFILLVGGVPMGIAIAGSSLASILASGDLPGILLPQRTFVQLDSFSLMAVPIFILAGEVMAASGITNRIVKLASSLIGHLRAGLAQASILASMLMAGISGAAAADASALGSILIPAMKEDGYDADFAVSVIASANTIGPIIPPSIMMIIYGSMTGVSIGKMFVGGVIPGILFGLGLMILTGWLARKRNFKTHPKQSLKQIAIAFKEALAALIMPIIIIGGILSGQFTPTEAGVVAVVYAFIVGFANRSIKLRDIKTIFVNAAMGTTTPMFLIGIAAVFGWILASNNLPDIIGGALWGVTTDPNIFIILVWALYIVIGCFMEDTAAMIILTPVLAPIAAQYGFDPVHFGVFTVVTLLIGTITPPVGMLLFICSSIGKVKLSVASKTIIPFCITLMIIALILGLVPQTITTLVKIVFP